MTAERPDDFPYEPACTTGGASARQVRWDIARGLQKVDDLETSDYLDQLAREHVNGARGIDETGRLLRAYYRERGHRSTEETGERSTGRTEEADLVSQRVVELLERDAFFLDPAMLFDVHRALFQDLDPETYHPGERKLVALQKREVVLNGDSVVYADPSLIDRALNFAIDDERSYVYAPDFDTSQLEHFSRFVSRFWQVHPFWEGNTRAVAVFAILYLRSLGFDVENAPFKQHAAFFRDALVRANYRNAKAGIMPDLRYLEQFFANVLCGADNELRSRDLMVQTLYDDPSLLRNVDPADAIMR